MRGNDIVVTGKIYPRSRDDEHIDLNISKGGTAWCSFNLSAWSHKNDDDDNEYISYRAVVFGDMAEYLVESVEPGDTVIVAGRLQANNWTDDDDNKRYDQQLMVDDIGLSVRWNPVTPVRVESSGGDDRPKTKAKARDDYGADEAPF